MGISYQQSCKFGPCFICADTGVLTGNGTALTNPVTRIPVPMTGPLWEAVVRAKEDVD